MTKRKLPRSMRKLEKELTKPAEPELDVEQAAERFAIPPGRGRKIARDVWKAEQKLSTTVFEHDSDLREYFRDEYQRQLQDKRTCGQKGCDYRYTTIEAAVVHHSLHLLTESKDGRTQRAIMKDIVELLHPTIETTVSQQLTGVLTDEDRKEALSDPVILAELKRMSDEETQ